MSDSIVDYYKIMQGDNYNNIALEHFKIKWRLYHFIPYFKFKTFNKY